MAEQLRHAGYCKTKAKPSQFAITSAEKNATFQKLMSLIFNHYSIKCHQLH
jgi:hypothetical protein